jgi:hypothetical protein
MLSRDSGLECFKGVLIHRRGIIATEAGSSPAEKELRFFFALRLGVCRWIVKIIVISEVITMMRMLNDSLGPVVKP